MNTKIAALLLTIPLGLSVLAKAASASEFRSGATVSPITIADRDSGNQEEYRHHHHHHRIWIEGHWQWTRYGWRWIPGHWEYRD